MTWFFCLLWYNNQKHLFFGGHIVSLRTDLERDLFEKGTWISRKFQLHLQATQPRVKSRQITSGEVWKCDLGYNIGDEKNKERPVLVISNNSINRSGKVVAICITDASGKTNVYDKPQKNSWVLLYADTTDDRKKFKAGRTIPITATPYSFLDKDSMAQCEEIRAVSKARFTRKLGHIEPFELNLIKNKLKITFDIP